MLMFRSKSMTLW